MARKFEYNSALTEQIFTDAGKFCRVNGARTICDASGKTLGSVSNDALFDLFGNPIAKLKSETFRVGASGGRVRVADYSAEKHLYRFVGDDLYIVEGDSARFLGRIARFNRNRLIILLLIALSALLLTAMLVIAIISLPVSETVKPVVEIEDNKGAWSGQKEVAVFDSTVHPGKEGKYDFVIRNPHAFEMSYEFYIAPVLGGVEQDSAAFPLEFRLYMNNVLISGQEWCAVSDLRFDEAVILPSTKQLFTIEWRWAFDGNNDKNDTLLGRSGGTVALVLNLTAQARA